MSLNREQGLFLVVLLVVGAMGYFRLTDPYSSVPMPRGKTPDEVEAPAVPEVVFPAEGDATYAQDGRDPFLPPRDWNPLPYLTLPWPPLPEIGAIEFVPAPGMELAHLSPLRREPPGESLTGGAPSANGGLAAGGDDISSGDQRFAGIDFGDAAPRAGSGPVVDVERTYDWVKRKALSKVWGTVLNSTPLKLLDDPTLAIDFETVNPKTGLPQGRVSFPREELEGGGAYGVGFGFADRVSNRVALLEREVRPGVGNTKTQIAAARTCLGWIEDDRDQALAGAERFLRSALSFSPKDAEAWELLAEVKARALDTEGELAVLEDAARAGVESARLQVARGRLARQLGLEAEAEEAFRTAMKQAPNDHLAFLELGRLLRASQRGAEAVEVLTTAEARAGSAEERLETRLELARAQIRIGDLSGARTRLEQVARMGIESAEALVLEGAAALIDGDAAKALGAFRSAQELDPRNRDAAFDAGVALAYGLDTDPSAAAQAKSRFEEAADLDPLTWFDSAVAIGAVDERLGNLERAADRFTEALEYHPNHPFGLYRAGRIARRLGDVEGAREALRTALEIDGRLVDVLNELGAVELLADRAHEAELYLRESVRREPSHDQAHVLLGFSLLRQNALREARAAFEAGRGGEDDPNPAALAGLAWCDYREEQVDQALQRLAESRAAAGDETDPFHAYAARHQALIEDNRAKEQWVDRFDRRQIRNNWEVKEPYGPTLSATGDGVAIRGMQRRTDPDEPTQLQRDIVGSTFVSLEADLTAEATNEGVLGIRFAYERATGREVLPQGEVALARFPDQTVRLFVRDDKSTVTEEWTPLEGAPSLPAGVPFTLAIERTDYDQGEFRVLVNGEVVRSGIESRMLKKVRQQCDGGVLVFAGGSKNVAATCDRVRIVRYRE